MLTVNDLSLSIQKVPILDGVALSIAEGETVGLIGRNGAGKTTLMRAIMGLIDRESGELIFKGRKLHAEKAHARAGLGIGYLPEDRRLVPHFTVEENILVPLWASKKTADLSRLKWVYDLMPEIGRFADRKALTLSGGQQKLVALARALVVGTDLLLLDEPFEGVAPALAQHLMEVISSLKDENLSVLISESDYTHSKEVVDKVYVIERGSINQMENINE
ncbi:ABC transporter ATP-binding protein [Cocleimonas flava]|uniref:Amino acid/amide ABC transporter ATP-binding protein 2 (HAAT family) n=1 Tax=Cocleimonas flava TaxID=634765 RepID=A0A4R1EYK0_9GAMM|nr:MULTISPECIES: ATP-binding cassette domain-containing protein [Cocleimonas]MEB8432673.1 ATP-binding cassette domain-containing protein [Cocleimonas sp. KMM 6892]MEC4715532.1 ATP-binding cassette domain-containing protein [Cocleimonas sp. KMM 6895]MEC4744850.1 ATP-binding cassette domain-containing protein [Cocleimonas sp. KMM 6896]TCJ83101.1 amino acid/amide ABC transporter ATP-binding protein 2 (HAAT family) [Cocleimonas flava]